MTKRAVLFDLDGVLIDSFEMWFAIMNEVAVSLACPPITREALEAAFGQGVEEDLRVFFRGATRQHLDAAYAEAMPRHAHRVAVNPEARTTLEALGARGLGRAIVTNTTHGAVTGVLERAGIADLCDVVVGTRPGIPEKPEPHLLLEACRALGVEPQDALMVGDTAYDERAAAAAGVPYLHYEMRSGTSLRAALDERCAP